VGLNLKAHDFVETKRLKTKLILRIIISPRWFYITWL